MHEWPTPNSEVKSSGEISQSSIEKSTSEWAWAPKEGWDGLLVAENAEVPGWYREEGYEESEHRRPGVRVLHTPEGVQYKAVWHVDMGVQDASFPDPVHFESIEDAQALIQREWEVFKNSTSSQEYIQKLKLGRKQTSVSKDES